MAFISFHKTSVKMFARSSYDSLSHCVIDYVLLQLWAASQLSICFSTLVQSFVTLRTSSNRKTLSCDM